MTMTIRSNTDQATSIFVDDMGLFLAAAAASPEVISEESELALASISEDLRVLATDNAYPGSADLSTSTVVILDGLGNAVAGADVGSLLSNLRAEVGNAPYELYGTSGSGSPAVALPGSEIVRTFQPGVVLLDAVYQRADGSVDRADASGGFTAGMPTIGFAVALNDPGPGIARIQFSGDISGFAGLVPQKIYVVGASPGTIVADDDTGNPNYPDTTPGSGHIMQEVGVAKDATTLFTGVNRDFMEF